MGSFIKLFLFYFYKILLQKIHLLVDSFICDINFAYIAK